MRKRGGHENRDSKNRQNGDDMDPGDMSDNENQGFGNWLRSSTAVEMMQLLVIANSILIFVIMGWSNMRESFYVLKHYLVGEEN
ncbi:hypothetical protein HN011_008124 [Eciton burchellii]|nr:hypothetical protein HN011_008124 [Eciton burchellii]